MHIQRVSECAIETDAKGKPLVRFPRKDKYDRTNRTIEGLEAAAGINESLFDFPPGLPNLLLAQALPTLLLSTMPMNRLALKFCF